MKKIYLKNLNLFILFILIFSLTSSLAFSLDLPEVNLKYSSYAISSDGKLIGYFGEENRVEVKKLSDISPYVVKALLATEDRHFYLHDGVSLKGLSRAVLQTLKGNKQGGSTITMQLAKNLYLSFERTISRKLTEITIAFELEKRYKKDEILLMYLNTVYFGRGAYGIWAAAQEYFGKTPKELTINESAMIVGLLKSPSGYDPSKFPEKALKRRNEVLHNLVEINAITTKDYQKLSSQPLNLKLRDSTGRHFLEYVRREADAILQRKGFSLYTDQLKVTTTLNYNLQYTAEKIVNDYWSKFPKNMQNSQIGLITLENGTGYIRTMIGGNPFSESRGLNRATQIKRQPGSSFKPFLYGALLNQGYTLATPLWDSAIVVNPGTPFEWRPMNDSDTCSNKPVPLKYALQNSLNLAAAYAITNLTTPDSVINFAHKCGITSEIPPYPSIALGTIEVTPIEMAAAFAVFPSLGVYAKPIAILKIEDKNGNIIYKSEIDTMTVISPETSYLITDALSAVVDSGTAKSIRKFYKGPAAGKTGTTQNSTDAWFVGYTPDLSTAIWVGFDDPQFKLSGIYRYGGTICAPIWGQLMNETVKNRKKTDIYYFNIPEYIEEMELCEETGKIADADCKKKGIYYVNTLQIPGYIHKDENNEDKEN